MRRSTETLLALCTAVLFTACGLTATQKVDIAKDAATVAVIEQRCEAAQKAAGGTGGLRAAVDAQCEADLDAFDRAGAKGTP